MKSATFTKILVVDDDEEDFIITREYLQQGQGHNVIADWCPDTGRAFRHMIQGDYDLYFIDYKLGKDSGLDLLKKATELRIDAPIILLTGMGNKAIDLQAMEAGAVDYLVKAELTAEKLERCMRYALERSRSLEQIRASEQKFRNIFERSKDIVFIADELLHFVDINAAATQLLGYCKEELLTMGLMQLMSKEPDRIYFREYLLQDKTVIDYECELLSHKKQRKCCIISLSRETNGKDQSYIQGIIHDITHIRKAEKETLQAEKFAATGRLVRMLGHEIRNPLTNIILANEQMEETTRPEMRMYWDIIDRNSKRITTLLAQLLNSSRPDNIKLEQLDLRNILEDSLSAAADRIQLKGISVDRRFAQEPHLIMADQEKLKIALLNIIVNAVEAMPENAGELRIVTEMEEAQYRLSIQDNGIGIPKEDLHQLFEPYFSSKKNGMGFGLAVTWSVLQLHQASVDVLSTPGHGTEFLIGFQKIGVT